MSRRLTGSFTARGDDGRTYTVHIYTNFTPAGTSGSPYAELPELPELFIFTSNWERVNLKEKGVYEVVSTGLVLRSDSPDAP